MCLGAAYARALLDAQAESSGHDRLGIDHRVYVSPSVTWELSPLLLIARVTDRDGYRYTLRYLRSDIWTIVDGSADTYRRGTLFRVVVTPAVTIEDRIPETDPAQNRVTDLLLSAGPPEGCEWGAGTLTICRPAVREGA